MTPSVVNALTIDVEDYYMVSAVESFVPKEKWGQYESRVVSNTQLILDLMDQHQSKATFFVVGWVAETFPELIKDIDQRGHEIACHSYYHRLVYDMTPQEFRKDLKENKKVLEDIILKPVVGYRAPSFSIVEESKWALDILAEEGFRYDASILPAAHARGGWIQEDAKRFPYQMGPLVEFPMSTIHVLGKRFPFSGGGYFRLFPYQWTRRAFSSLNNGGHPVINYLHPWEFDPGQPKMPINNEVLRFKHYVNLSKTQQKFMRLLGDFKFQPVYNVLRSAGLLQ